MQNYLEKFFQSEITITSTISYEKIIFSCENKKYIVWSSHSPDLLQYLDNYQYTPKILSKTPYVIQEWLDGGKPFDINNYNVDMLLPLHTKELPMNSHWLNPIDNMWLNLSDDAREFITNQSYHWHKFKQEIKMPKIGNICHGDIHPGNLIYTDQPYLIDWEWLCIAPKEFDLAMLKQYMTEDAFTKICDSYPVTINYQLLQQYQKLCLYRCALWALQNINGNLSLLNHTQDIQYFRTLLVNNNFSYSRQELIQLAQSALKAFIDLH